LATRRPSPALQLQRDQLSESRVDKLLHTWPPCVREHNKCLTLARVLSQQAFARKVRLRGALRLFAG
jgi:hypothetical protein